ncbi:MAG: pyruvate dehydrogenase (acetyl-transferring) E1 component subunit alpha [Candidatus Micrarchaeota archaeon]
MPISTVFEGKVEHMQILDKDGNVDAKLEPKLPKETLDRMYRSMVLARVWDRKCVALQRTGRMFTYAPLEGQEAIGVGAVNAVLKEDWMFPTYREFWIYHLRGGPLEQVDLNWMGVEEGLKLDKNARIFPYAVPISSHLPHAVGAAYALRQKGEKSACIAFCGDGATSEGDFHDAMNFAGVWNAPVVFVMSNNGWAISVPRKNQTHSKTLAQKALAYGFEGVQVDGNDILAVYKAVKDAADAAREGAGPKAIECITYRMGPHTTADDPKRYRTEDELAFWRERDPISRFRIYLERKGAWNESYEKAVFDEATRKVEVALVKAEAFRQDPRDMFRFIFAGMTKDLQEQMGECFDR